MFFFDVGLFYLIYGLLATFVMIPILSIFHGKRYCTWFCGCGGLAETLGDRWRHLSPKGKVSRRWEWMNMAVMIWAFVAAIFVIAARMPLIAVSRKLRRSWIFPAATGRPAG